jgi:hypothetical protein
MTIELSADPAASLLRDATEQFNPDSRTLRFAPTGRELYYAASGLPLPSPTDEEIAAVIGKAMGLHFFGTDAQAPLFNAARAVRALFPTNTAKDSA